METTRLRYGWVLLVVIAATLVLNGVSTAGEDDDVKDIASEDRSVGKDGNKRYFVIDGQPELDQAKAARPLLIVLPGGDGSADFHPFIKRVYKNALAADYLVVQLVAPKWSPDQAIVWPTQKNPAKGQKFTTEQFVAAVINDVKSRYKLDEGRVFTLAWSSSGPAAYAISLDPKVPVRGSFIAMSVYKPSLLPPLDRAKGHAYFLLHSPKDMACPYVMAKAASQALAAKGAATKLVEYDGGHGWHGDPFGNIRLGIEWLEKNAKAPATGKSNAGRR